MTSVVLAAILARMGIYAVSEFGELAAGNAAVSAINGALTASSAATDAAASTITPPGGEGASVKAVAQQIAAVNHFNAMFAMGMEQLMERVTGTTLFGAAGEAVEAANAASFAV